MFYKYLKLILFLTVVVQSAPELLIVYGETLERFQHTCQSYQKISSLPVAVKNKCRTYISKANKAFKFGYTLDRRIANYTLTKNQEDRYFSLLDKLNKHRLDILKLLYTEKKQAQEENNFEYYKQLISSTEIELSDLDYKFMKKHKDIFAKHFRYMNYESNIRFKKNLKEAPKRQSNDTREQYKRKPKEHTANPQRTQTQTYKRARKPINNTRSIIMKDCTNKWGTDYRMVKYCIEKQSKAKNIVLSMPNNTIKANCKKKWGNDHRMVKYCVEKQSAAERIVTSEKCQNLWGTEQRQCLEYQRKIGKALMARCKKKWGNDHRMVKYCVEKQSAAYKEISSIADNAVQDECKNKWGNDKRACISKQMKRQRELSPILDECKKKWGNDHRMVKYCVENK